MSTSLRTPLGRVRGHGSAKEGTGHFIAQRASAVALVFLSPWLVIALALGVRDYESARAFAGEPLNAVGLLLFVAATFVHMRIGMQEVIVDYVAKPFNRALLLLANTFVSYGFAAAAAFAVLKISLGA